jgi:hypothetical protein
VVLIESTLPTRSPLPVLTRGPLDVATGRDRGVMLEPGLVPPVPMLDAVVPQGGQPVARLGETIDLAGHHLDGTDREVVLANDRFGIDETLAAAGTGGAALIQFSIPLAQAADFPVGVYRVGARLVRPGEAQSRETNRLAMTLAPQITGLPMVVVRDGAENASFNLSFHPMLRAGQTVSLVLGQQEFQPEPFAPPVALLAFVIPQAPVGNHLVRLRIDGIDSPVIDRSVVPPRFLDQRIDIQ